MVEPEPAQQLGDRKVENCLATGAQMVVTSNPGCILQIAAGLQRAGHDIPVKHMIEIVDASITGRTGDLLSANKH